MWGVHRTVRAVFPTREAQGDALFRLIRWMAMHFSDSPSYLGSAGRLLPNRLPVELPWSCRRSSSGSLGEAWQSWAGAHQSGRELPHAPGNFLDSAWLWKAQVLLFCLLELLAFPPPPLPPRMSSREKPNLCQLSIIHSHPFLVSLMPGG